MSSLQQSTEASPVTIGGTVVKPGERRNFVLEVGKRLDGSPIGIPVVVVNGERPGPKLGIVAGVHGDEYEGPQGLREFLAGISVSELRGCVVATPHANPLAAEVFHRVNSIDHLDLNRSFPGRADGYVTERIANLVSEEIIGRVDYLIDLHSGGLTLDLLSYVAFDDSGGPLSEVGFEMAKAAGIELLYGSAPFPNVVRIEAARRNVPAILVEVGGQGRLNRALVPLMSGALSNVARHLDMLDGEPEQLPGSYRVVNAPSYGEFLHSPSGGFLMPKASLGDNVEAGQLLGVLVDAYGDELARIEAPVAGLLTIERTMPVTRVGDWTYSVLPVVARADATTTFADLANALSA